MATTEHPITRSELREELDRVLQHYATKEDLANLKSDLTWRMLIGQFLGIAAIAAVMQFLS